MADVLNQIIAQRVRDKLNFPAEVRIEPFDFGNFLGVAVVLSSKRHAVKVKIDRCDLTNAADEAALALNDWADNG